MDAAGTRFDARTGCIEAAGAMAAPSANQSRVALEVRAVVAWYLEARGRNARGRGPFYCDPTVVGAFAVDRDALAAGEEAAVFRVFVTLSMYQALRDVVIARQQKAMSRRSVRVVADLPFVRASIMKHDCPVLQSVDGFEVGCDVAKSGGVVDCSERPGARCHVKDATRVFNRMGDMGKLPTSAWLRLWKAGGVNQLLADVCGNEASPTKRAALLVQRFAQVHRVGRKLATMFVSALSTPALAPGVTPWFPKVDGNDLVVVDTNVARAVDALREPGAERTYGARERWLREQAAQLDLRDFGAGLPKYSPRLIQEALYAFCSKSNRTALGDPCAKSDAPCVDCAPSLCPFASASS